MSNINEVKEIWNTIIEKTNNADYIIVIGAASLCFVIKTLFTTLIVDNFMQITAESFFALYE